MFELWKTTQGTTHHQPEEAMHLEAFNHPLHDGVEQSIACRRKDTSPMNINAKCKSCDRVFRRPCDLTKHEKTHSRPWKCTEPSCKYFEIGWPTEKERDRHINDKHSRSPIMYKCRFPPCNYQSKRESNCKQHMEKAHGWAYIRSKNNGKGSSTRGSPVQATPMSTQTTPATPSLPTPFFENTDYYNTPLITTNPFSDPLMPIGHEDFQLFSDSNLLGNLTDFPEFSPLPPEIPEFEQLCQPPATNDGIPEAFSLGIQGGQGDLMLYTPASTWMDDDLL
ncbi:copper-binding transcription factor [Monascus purpureus]|uniref:Copper-binding transcription factor n=1 Tax=Monascus purpureus TaxID=5098 RepID=A0A507QK20_MONPU|nr:copper-binding transcription factor [Monascus purpureus]BDD63490.1 hypothetical protein MAP00_008373 [Monascus purpureus]